MEINGNIQVYSGSQLIAQGENLITNTGKSIFLDWLSHNSYQNSEQYINDRLHKIYNGASLSDQRFVSNLTFTLEKNIDEDNSSDGSTQQSVSGLKMFYSVDNAIDINNQTLYASFDVERNISGVYINAQGSTNHSDNYCYANEVKIYYSTETSTVANISGKWKLLKVVMNNFIDSSNQQSSSKLIRFDSINTADGYIKAKSFKFEFVGLHDYKIKLRGIGFLEKLPYPNIPCVIGLGSGKNTPTLSDTKLSQQVCKLFVNKQLCKYEKTTENLDGTKTTQLIQFDLNSRLPNKEDLAGVNKINIIYISRINYSQYNNIQFNEIGLFFSKKQTDYQKNALSVDQMFSHGLFSEGWVKDSSQLIDIKYTISITV